MRIKWYCSLLIASCLNGCGVNRENKTAASIDTDLAPAPVFNADSAYAFIETQVAFGPRIPNTTAHDKAKDHFVSQLKSYGAVVKVQEFEATTFDRQRLKLKNIIASFNPEKQKRILLAAHWDTRPFADKDSIKKDAPFDGANDGGSGVGVLLEVARQLGQRLPAAGVDIILFDGEDWGERDNEANRIQPPDGFKTWWCLGSQYWANNKHKPSYTAYYGILLDMVGAKGSHFYREGISLEYAPKIVEKVWTAGDRLGYSSYFIKQNKDGITDDHAFVNQIAKIPMIDIVHVQSGGGFGDYHHTQKDNMSIISKETLKAVGQTLLEVIYMEE